MESAAPLVAAVISPAAPLGNLQILKVCAINSTELLLTGKIIIKNDIFQISGTDIAQESLQFL